MFQLEEKLLQSEEAQHSSSTIITVKTSITKQSSQIPPSQSDQQQYPALCTLPTIEESPAWFILIINMVNLPSQTHETQPDSFNEGIIPHGCKMVFWHSSCIIQSFTFIFQQSDNEYFHHKPGSQE